jgi:hypothetical protein
VDQQQRPPDLVGLFHAAAGRLLYWESRSG